MATRELDLSEQEIIEIQRAEDATRDGRTVKRLQAVRLNETPFQTDFMRHYAPPILGEF